MMAAAELRQDFASIVREHQSMVYSLALHFLRDPGRAEDLAQEVFLQLHGKLAGLESDAHVAFWLRRVTCHRCIDQLRRFRHQAESSLEQAGEPVAPDKVDDPMLSERIRRLVASLPAKSRLAVILRYQEDLEPEEIAEVMGMPVRSVKSHLHKGLELLREKARRTLGEVVE